MDKKNRRIKQSCFFHQKLTLFLAALSVLRESCWYWGNISGDRAREVLQKCSPGTFLIRDSSDKR